MSDFCDCSSSSVIGLNCHFDGYLSTIFPFSIMAKSVKVLLFSTSSAQEKI
jgi:hypothetical protein